MASVLGDEIDVLAKAKRAKILADETGAERARLNRIFDACFRIQREASEAAGRHIPLVVENVRGAQEWVGKAVAHFGSFYLWGDVPLPLPDGRFSRFRVEESPMLAPELAAAFPSFKTYRGTGLDDLTASARFGWTDAGFHAAIQAAGGSVYIDAYSQGDISTYVSYRESDLRNDRKDLQPR